jgi:hypothetical protein
MLKVIARPTYLHVQVVRQHRRTLLEGSHTQSFQIAWSVGRKRPVWRENLILPQQHQSITCTMFASKLRTASLRVVGATGTRTAATVAGNAAKQTTTNYYQPVLLAAGLTLAATTFVQQVRIFLYFRRILLGMVVLDTKYGYINVVFASITFHLTLSLFLHHRLTIHWIH